MKKSRWRNRLTANDRIFLCYSLPFLFLLLDSKFYWLTSEREKGRRRWNRLFLSMLEGIFDDRLGVGSSTPRSTLYRYTILF